jgi:hypothetical protein
MQKFESSPANNPANPNKMAGLSLSEELDEFDFDDKIYNSKMKVECICPTCSQKHIMAFHWIGRGTPRKYCPACKGGSSG